MTPRWVTAFLDLPDRRHDAGLAFWQAVTGCRRSATRGAHDEFVTLLPDEGDGYLRVQRVPDEPPRLHLDLHVDDPGTAADELSALGASLRADQGSYVTLASPGGFTFCLVPDDGSSTRPRPGAWPDGHTSYVDQVCLDVPPGRYDAELDFWAAAMAGWQRRDPTPGSEFGRVTPGPEQPLQLLVQRLDDEQDAVTAHLDWSASDHDAEVGRHVAAGAERGKSFAGWTVLRDPAGMTYCITRRTPGDRPE